MRLQPTPSEYLAQGFEQIDRRLRRLERRDTERLTWVEYEPTFGLGRHVSDYGDSYLRGWYADAGGVMVLHGLFIPGAGWGSQFVLTAQGLRPDNVGGADIWPTGALLNFGLPEVGLRLIDPTGYGAYYWGDGYERPTEHVWQFGPALIAGPNGSSFPAVACIDDNQQFLYAPHHRTRYLTIGVQNGIQDAFFGYPRLSGQLGTYWPIRWANHGTGDWRVIWSMMLATAEYDETAAENPYEILTPFG